MDELRRGSHANKIVACVLVRQALQKVKAP